MHWIGSSPGLELRKILFYRSGPHSCPRFRYVACAQKGMESANCPIKEARRHAMA